MTGTDCYYAAAELKIIEQNILACGLVTELSKSQTKNFETIRSHWMLFNEELKKYQLNAQNGKSWEKYGITFKRNESYFYLSAIPQSSKAIPEHFITKVIPKGEYGVFTHTGKMSTIKQTIYTIYKDILPHSNLAVEHHLKTGFIHFEKYDYRFLWDKPTSIIDIYLPLNTSFE